MHVVSLVSQKGGSGKTTTAIHLAVASQLANKQALIVDLDPQASATKWKDLRSDETPVVISAQSARLTQTLDTARKANADLVIIDTPPHSDSIAVASIRAADLVLIPCRTSVLDLQAIQNTVDLLQVVNKKWFVVFTNTHPSGSQVAQLREALGTQNIPVAPHYISQRSNFQHALTVGKSAQEYEPNGKAAEEIARLYSWTMDMLR